MTIIKLLPLSFQSVKTPRHGVTLLEILITIFVLAIGLLGVMMLIPVGNIEITKAGINHRKATNGQAAFRRFRIQGYSRPEMWLRSGRPVVQVENGNVINTLAGKPVVIDPLGVAFSSSSAMSFPASGGSAGMARLSLRTEAPLTEKEIQGAGAKQMGKALAKFYFTSQDDLEFNLPSDDDMVAQQKTPTIGPKKRLARGDYSWMVTLVPSPSDPNMYAMSTIVFYDRKYRDNLEQSELTATVNSESLGLNGGHVQLQIQGGTTGEDDDPYDNLKIGRWMMLMDTANRQYKWYEIIGIGSESSGQSSSSRQAGGISCQLRGPDWTSQKGDIKAVIPVGAITVYEKTIKLEGPSPWLRPSVGSNKK